MKKLGKIVYKESTSGDWYFVVKAPNGQTLVTSEMYLTKQSAAKGVNSLIKVITGEYEIATEE